MTRARPEDLLFLDVEVTKAVVTTQPGCDDCENVGRYSIYWTPRNTTEQTTACLCFACCCKWRLHSICGDSEHAAPITIEALQYHRPRPVQIRELKAAA